VGEAEPELSTANLQDSSQAADVEVVGGVPPTAQLGYNA